MRAASLQELSEGRFVLGIGPGDPPMLDRVGLRQRRPLSGLREAVDLVRRLLRGDDAAIDGTVFRGWTAKARLTFRVPSAPIPIYIGGQGPKVLEYMGEAGDGGLPIVFPPETIDAVAGRVRAGAARAGRSLDNFDLAACVWWSIGNTPAEAQEALRPLIAYYGPSLREETLAPIGLSPADFDPIRAALKADEMARAQSLVRPEMFRLAIAGDPEQLTERVRWLAARDRRRSISGHHSASTRSAPCASRPSGSSLGSVRGAPRVPTRSGTS